MKNRMYNMLLGMVAVLLLVGCQKYMPIDLAGGEVVKPDIDSDEFVVEKPEAESVPLPLDPKEAIDLNLKPNEMGKIMVLMYHNIGEEEADWVRTPENFQKDLETLYLGGYRPISLTDFATGNITTEQGYTPVVITFDDANENNFRILEDGTVDPQCAIGVLLDFHKTHPDFPMEVTFFADGPSAFGASRDEEEKINRVIELGFDIGNHTWGHANFKQASAEDIQREIGKQVLHLESMIHLDHYRVNTIALPYGSRPADDSLMEYLHKGTYEGMAYENLAILNVGSHPSSSPFDMRFDALSIPRVRASEMNVGSVGMYNFLDYFENHPEERFISDGQPQIITAPYGWEEFVIETDKELYLYSFPEE